ncbi:MAG: hypothetical protein AAF497_29725, partial [Planctomycetota bacterium]
MSSLSLSITFGGSGSSGSGGSSYWGEFSTGASGRTGAGGVDITVDGCDGLFRVFYTGEDTGTPEPEPGGCDGSRQGLIGPNDDGG